MINGSVSFLLSMNFNGLPGEMMLTTRNNPALFSIMSKQAFYYVKCLSPHISYRCQRQQSHTHEA